MRTKRSREEHAQKPDRTKKIKKSHEDAAPKPPPTKEPRLKSALVQDEVDFPRGGGSTLTPFEYKEIQAEAAKEVANELNFEDSQTKKAKSKSRARGKSISKGKSSAKDGGDAKDTIRVEHLNYKRLITGTRILCQVVAIRPLALIVSLPHQLMGHVPITHISNLFTERLENMEESEEEEEGEEEQSEDESGDERAKTRKDKNKVPELHEIFKVGQYLRAVVTAVRPAGASAGVDLGRTKDEVEKASRRVELSVAPAQVNAAVSKRDLGPGFNISGAVKSVEDHGYILDFGITDVSAFLSFSDAKKAFPEKLSVGQLVETSVQKMSENGRTCSVSVDPSVLKSASVSEVTTVGSVLPGALVNALVTAVLPWGLNVQILGFFEGTLDLFHLKNSAEIESKYKLGQKIKVRILWDIISTSPRKFALSALPHIVSLRSPRTSTKQSVPESYPIGTIFDVVKVERVESEWGLVCGIADDVKGFVHISQVSDDHVPSLSATSGMWKVGTTHRARAVGFSALDGILLISLQPSILDQKFLQVADVHVGEVIKATVIRLADVGLFLSVSNNVEGVVWPTHFADIKLKHPERRFKPGATVKCRVLWVDPERKRLRFTLKKTLVESELPAITQFSDATVGMVTHGVVSKIFPKSLLVEYYSGVRASVPLREASETAGANLESDFFVGQVVKTRVIALDSDTSRITASIRQAASSFQAQLDVSAVEIGSSCDGVVTEIHKDNVLVTLKPVGVRALVSLNNLANHRETTSAQLRSTLKVGEILSDLVVVTKNVDKGIVIAANRPKARESTAANKDAAKKIRNFNSFKVGEVISGRVLNHGRATSILLSKHVRGVLHPTDVSDDYSKAAPYPPVDSDINVVVTHIDHAKKRITLSARPSRVSPGDSAPVIDREIESVQDLKVGDSVRGFVKSVADHGLFVTIGRDVDARVQIKELFDDYVKDWKPRFQENQVVQGRILALDTEKKQVELTFRSGDLARSSKSALQLRDFEEGQKVDALVKRVEPYGVFVSIKGSRISGLCHKSQISDNKDADVAEALKGFREGDPVRAIILKINLETGRIDFGLKPSYFESEDFDMEVDEDDVEEEGEDEDDDGDDDGDEEAEEEREDEGEESDESEHAEEESDEEADGVNSDGEESSDFEVILVDEPESIPERATPARQPVPTLQLSGGFSWSNPTADTAIASGSESSDDEDGGQGPSKKSKRKRRHEIQRDLTTDMHTKTPESTGEFERLVLASPNSSFLWIQYMSFQLQLSEVDKAREIGRRALQAINFREEQEKLNVWTALLNLETMYGSDETLDAVFKDAARHNDSKTMHLRLAEILDQAQKSDKAEELYRRTSKKFGASSKVWTHFGEHYFKASRVEDARKLLPRSLQSLEKRKHLKTISKFAQMEYKLADPERGKTIFEGIIDSHPKRLDLWSVYMDMEISQGNIQSLRNIFERVFTQKLSTKKAKFFFKKWLEVERSIGTEEGADLVKEKAVEWTQRKGVQDAS
ncbi:hypothetical protein BOTBODRAFT_29943 [Botryobasidium botryosum FD-172 SS1]|uniref:S1 motif domain-containing protein n=1 Tax=Botryobasidium botryosum (strain FD-172 SS1) TaxID=930990 RepID=A0A067MQE8_BOTB1|nr:hypothetical protein BOTBODRAFT_29943 [Botryobasidium botryosum FD-172 SS1]